MNRGKKGERAREYLEELRCMDIFIRQRKEQIEELRERIHSVRAIDNSVEKRRGGVKKEYGVIERYLDMENEVEKLIDEFLRKKNEIIGKIQEIKNPVYCDVIYRRYVEFKALEKIADEINYNYNYVRRIHGEALRFFEVEVMGLTIQSKLG